MRPCFFLSLVSFQTLCSTLHTRKLLRTNQPPGNPKQTLTSRPSPASDSIVTWDFGVVRMQRAKASKTRHENLGRLTEYSKVSEGTPNFNLC